MSQRKQPMVRVVVRPQTENESRRFAVAVDLLLADIVRKVMESKGTERDETVKPSGQAIHRSAPLQ
jgi:hypothetical protein